MSKAILNKRDKMMWDNSFKPDGVNDTLDLVSEHIEDIVEDHIVEIGKSVERETSYFKKIVDITFEEEASALNIDLETELSKCIVIYTHPAITGAPSTSKALNVITNSGEVFNILYSVLDGATARADYIECENLGTFLRASGSYSGYSTTSTFTSGSNALRLSTYDIAKEHYISKLLGTFNIPIGARLLVYGVEA